MKVCFFVKRAEDIIDMVDKTTNEFKTLDDITGEKLELVVQSPTK